MPKRKTTLSLAAARSREQSTLYRKEKIPSPMTQSALSNTLSEFSNADVADTLCKTQGRPTRIIRPENEKWLPPAEAGMQPVSEASVLRCRSSKKRKRRSHSASTINCVPAGARRGFRRPPSSARSSHTTSGSESAGWAFAGDTAKSWEGIQVCFSPPRCMYDSRMRAPNSM